jgi:hypothetical protein
MATVYEQDKGFVGTEEEQSTRLKGDEVVGNFVASCLSVGYRSTNECIGWGSYLGCPLS